MSLIYSQTRSSIFLAVSLLVDRVGGGLWVYNIFAHFAMFHTPSPSPDLDIFIKNLTICLNYL